MRLVRIQRDDFDPAAETASLVDAQSDVGALVSFIGICRSEGGRISALELEHYPSMAEAEIDRIVAEAEDRWALNGIVAIYRYGRILPGEKIVMVAAGSAHRREAFAAAEFVMDFLKTQAPFWKRKILPDGSVGGWEPAKEIDEAAKDRWVKS